MSNIFKNYKYHALFFLTFLISFIIKILNTEYIFDGSDIPGHVLASITLRETSVLETVILGNNFLIRLGQFTHGYTMLFLNWLSYELFFEILSFKVNESAFFKIHSLFSTIMLIPIYLFLNKHLNNRETLLAILIISLVPIHIFISRAHVGPINFSYGFFFLTLYWLDNLMKEINNKNIIYFSLSCFFYIGSFNLFILGFFFHLIYYFIFTEDLSINKTIKFILKIYFNLFSILLIILPMFSYLLITLYSIHNNISYGFIIRIIDKVTDKDTIGVVEILSGQWFSKLKFIIEYFGPIIFFFFYKVIIDFYKKKINKISLFLLIYFVIFILLVLISFSTEPSYFLVVVVTIAYFVVKDFKRTNKFIFGLFLILQLFYTTCYIYSYPFNIGKKDFILFNESYHDKASIRVAIGTYNPKVSFDNGQKAASYLLRERIIKPGFTTIKKRYFGNIKRPYVYTKKMLDISMSYYFNDDVFAFNDFELSKMENSDYVFLYPYGLMDEKEIDFLNEKNNLKLLVNICEDGKKILGIYGSEKLKNLPDKCLDNKILNKKFENQYFLLKDFSKIHLGVF